MLAIESRKGLLSGIESDAYVGLYHSWVVEEAPIDFEITSRSREGLIMSMIHRALDIQSVQFHPESYMTSHGQQMIETWLSA
jgi:anthranilate synthase component 2